MDILPIVFVVDLRKLNFLHKQSMHVMTIVNAAFYIFGFREYDILCTRYSVTNGQFRKCVWNAFFIVFSALPSFSFSLYTYYSVSSAICYTVLCELK